MLGFVGIVMGVKAWPIGDDIPIPSSDDFTFVVMWSGGLSSYEAARRCVDQFGKERVVLWFADTKTEDADLYRFNDEASKSLGLPIRSFVIIGKSGEPLDLWSMARERKFIPNSRADMCSRVFKREPLRAAMKDEFTPDNAIVVMGFDNIEDCGRIERGRASQAPFPVYFPLLEGATPFKRKLMREVKASGIDPPRLYELGFTHNNCGGFCVKAGLGQFAHLLKTLPDVYAHHEEQERITKELLKSPHTALSRGGNPLSLTDLREMIEAGKKFSYKELNTDMSCDCFSAWFD